MCLGIPGKIVETFDFSGTKMAKVDFGGVLQDVCIETVPDAEIGDFVIVHAGFALNKLSVEDAMETLAILEEMKRLADLDDQKNHD